MLSELDVLRDLVARLDGAGIEYMLTGPVAMNFYAQPRMTRDVDLVVALHLGQICALRIAWARTTILLPRPQSMRFATRACSI